MRKLAARLRSLLIWLITLPVFLAACAAIWLASFVLRGPSLERLIKAGCRAVLFVAGVRVQGRAAGRTSSPAASTWP
ncbi:MAG: hypothetical protein MZU91_11570 [Desulfosudis oleivorans]|nr:hypothetical protein [Desulfosudis oleivorans]